MIDSYEDDGSPVGWLYDNALALIVLTDAGKENDAAVEAAHKLAAAFIAAQEDNSWWWEGYDTTNGSPYIETKRGSGVQAWMAYALAFYGFTHGDLDAISAAENYASYCIDNFRDKGAGKFDYWGGYDVTGDLFPFKVFEQNINIWWMFNILRDLHSHEGRRMNEWADLLWQELSNPDNGYWNVSERRWNASIDFYGMPSTLVAEDCQSLGAILAYFNRDSDKSLHPLNFSHNPDTGLISTISSFQTDLHGIITVKGFEDYPPWIISNIWNGGTAHESVALSYLDYSPMEGIDSRYWLDYLMDVQNLSTIFGDPDKTWFHSLIDDPGDGHYGPDYGLHVGESCWVYFAINNFLEDELLPYYENIWILRLSIAFYQEEFDYYSAAASSKMVLDYIREDAILTQDELYSYGYSNNHSDNLDILDIDPLGLEAVLNHYKPEEYNFGISVLDTITDSLRDICHWLDYEIPDVNRPNTPVIVPTYGGYDNWMVIRGCSTSNDPSESDRFSVNGFWVNDPAVSEIGATSYKTAVEWKDAYFLPVTTGDPMDGRYVAVTEPPETLSQAKVFIPEVCITDLNDKLIRIIKNKEKFKLKLKKGICRAASLVSVQGNPEEFSSWQGIIDFSLLQDPGFMEAFQDATARSPIYVKRTDKDSCDYYLVPFDKTIDQEVLTSLVLIIDANDGYFKEASWVSEPVEYMSSLEEEDIELAWEPGEESSSPYYPYAASPGLNINITARYISDNRVAPWIDFGRISGGTSYSTPSIYVEIEYASDEVNWAIEIYTDNTSWAGPTDVDRGGLIGRTHKDMRVPLIWQVRDDVQPAYPILNQAEVDAGYWTWVKDKGDPDWADSNVYRQVLTGNATWTWLHGYPGGHGLTSDITPVVLYLGGKFDDVAPGDYSSTLIFDLYHW